MLRLSAPFRSTFYLLSFYFRRIIFQRFPVPCFVSCTSPFALHFSALCRLAPCLCALPFVLCLPCVISRRRILHHFVSCTSPFALHSLCCVVWRLVSYTSPLSLSLPVLHRTVEAYRSSSSAAALLSKARLADSPPPDKLCQLLLSCFDSVPRAFGNPPECARPSSGQAPLSL